MFRRISTKWVLSVLAVGVVPFLGFAWFVNVQMADRLWDVVRYYLQSIAADLAQRVDDEILERRTDVGEWADRFQVEMAIEVGPGGPVAMDIQRRFDDAVLDSHIFGLLLVVDEYGRYVTSNGRDFRGASFAPELREHVRTLDYREREWFARAMRGEIVLVDQHESDLVPPRNVDEPGAPENYHFGFAVPVVSRSPDDVVGLTPDAGDKIVGVVYGLVNWGYIQYDILKPDRGEYFQGLATQDIYATSYAWLWKSDCDTILGHKNYSLYGKRVSEPPIELPQLVEAARSAEWGMYPEYEFVGVEKNAAFRHCAGPEHGGFGWVVGIGIDNKDIYATIDELRRVLLQATFIVLGGVVLWTIYMARRTTRPIIELQKHTHRIASGDLDARVKVDSRDELGELADAFNRMTAELSESRKATVKAEKEAAWREMARQVAHEIKNPLTPISLSANLLLRARRENSPEFDSMLERTIDMIQRQVGNMREIASDFSAFAGTRNAEPEVVDVMSLVSEVLDASAAWADEAGVEIALTGEKGVVFANPRELERVFLNLSNNAFEAMPDGGRLDVSVLESEGWVIVEFADTGAGLTSEVRDRLFEPYFTTRTHGTGLGLAICKRVIDELGGEIKLFPAPEGSGTVARIRLPRYQGA